MLRALVFLFAILFAFQNCKLQPNSGPARAGDRMVSPNGKEPYTLEGNGDIYDGKTEYVVVDRFKECGPSGNDIRDRIVVENNQLFQVVKNCQPVNRLPVDPADVEVAPHDSDILFYKNQAFVDANYDNGQVLLPVGAAICRKSEMSDDKEVVSVTHTYWTAYSDNGVLSFTGRTLLGNYVKKTSAANTYQLNSLLNFAEQILTEVPDMADMMTHVPPMDPAMQNNLMFTYGGSFPSPNTYLLHLMGPTPGMNYTKAHLVMMDNQTEHKITDMDCYVF